MEPVYRRHGVSDRTGRPIEPHPPGREERLGRHCPKQPPVYRRRILDSAHGRALARSAANLRRLEKHAPSVLPLARQRRLVLIARGLASRSKDWTPSNLLADRGCDTNEIVETARRTGMEAVIPPKKNRKVQREYDKHIYRQRHPVENAFLKLKRWRGIATRYAPNAASFLAAVQIRCLAIWLNIS